MHHGIHPIIPGHASALRCTSAAGIRLDLINIHLTTYGQARDLVHLLRRGWQWARSRSQAATAIAGDANFVDAVEGRLNVDAARPEFTEEVAAADF